MAPIKHGQSKRAGRTPEYGVWRSMLHRCSNPTDLEYARYGGRGIKVCERWRSFANFFADMGARPSPRHSIDREDNDGDYEASNCRWATAKEQAANRRRRVDSPDLTGRRFGRWLVVEEKAERYVLCRCECGVEKQIRKDYLLLRKHAVDCNHAT